MKKGLSATQLKVIAIIAMFIDHTAWGFVEMFSPLGQIMHVLGRFTIPIMSFFVAEGYRKTSNLRRYIARMTTFGILTIIPFTLFFGEEYGYRQNFILDLLMALLVLTVVDHKTLPKPLKVILATLLFGLSTTVGGWPILPEVLVLIFYYGKDYKKTAIRACIAIVLLVACMPVIILLNQRFHFLPYDWVWYQWFYFLGFILPLFLLGKYNGEKGTYPLGKYFFFLFYPGHFLLLYGFKLLLEGKVYNVYISLHVLCLICALGLLLRVIKARASKASTSCILLIISGCIYIFGFIIEILTGELSMSYAGCIVEYFGEMMLFICFLWFMSEFCDIHVSSVCYASLAVMGSFIMYLLMTTQKNGLFYTSMSMNYDGPFPRLVLEYGTGFYAFQIYAAIICIIIIGLCIKLMNQDKGIVKKRATCILFGILCPWLAIAIRATGITNGYEISAIGVLGSTLFIQRAVIKYDFFDSVQLAGENAMHLFGDGILVVDPSYKTRYLNIAMEKLLPGLSVGDSVKGHAILDDLFFNGLECIKTQNKIYETKVIPLTHGKFTQGYMLSAKDMTEHYKRLEEVERYAHTDSLTGLYNRSWFSELYRRDRHNKLTGCLLMFDLDNFKGINDTLGHEVGDMVLNMMANTLKQIAGDDHLCCRIGGDEFMMWVRNITKKEELAVFSQNLIDTFHKKLSAYGYDQKTGMSIGGYILPEIIKDSTENDFRNAYRLADEMLYEAKHAGKGVYRLK